MGNCCPLYRFHRRSSAINPKNVTLLLVGLDDAGKTTIAKRLLQEPLDGVIPTVGFSRVTLQEKGCSVTIYDLGGGPQIRDIWPRYYADVHGVIFVIDAFNIERMNECKKTLEGVLMDGYISGKPVLLLANKQDLDGALDEIDIVDRLNVEPLVNQQKCPTLVELCSAKSFSKRMDAGILSGYKWLLRSITKDYPTLNNRVLKDVATQEEFERIKRVQREERINREKEENAVTEVESHTGERYQNGRVQMMDNVSIPGQIEDEPRKSSPRPSMGSRDVKETYVMHSASSSCEFFKYERDDYDVMLIQNMGDSHGIKNFLVRPKSSGARLDTTRTDTSKRKTPRQKSYHRKNKTAPSPVTDLILEPMASPPRIFGRSNATTGAESKAVCVRNEGEGRDLVIEFACDGEAGRRDKGSKSTPGSRGVSATSGRRRCMSGEQDSGSKSGKLLPLRISTTYVGKELVLDVTNLED